MHSCRLFVCLLLLPCLLHADATREDWIGSYAMNHDGHVGTLTVFLSTAGCRSVQCQGLSLQYVDSHGTYPGTVSALDENGQHLAFTIEFPGNTQRFDVYIFGFDKTKFAGTTVWGGRIFGVLAAKNNVQPAGIRAAEHMRAVTLLPAASSAPSDAAAGTPQRVMPDGTVETRYPDGTVRSHRIGRCSGSTRYPDGRVVPVECAYAEVMPLIPPDPPSGSTQARWLKDQDDELLSILQGLLGGSTSSDFRNYLNNYENPPDPEIYKRIYLRTQAIAELAAGPK